jgi:type IV fimbrial biogenesis protein FimT
MRKMHGLTLIELMVTVAIAALLAALAGPSFLRVIQSSNISGGVNTFLADVRYARSEAVKRGGRVVMCRSDDPEAPAPACSVAAHARGWSTGWVIFQDLDGDNTWSAGDNTLRVQAPLATVTALQGDGNSTIFGFTATGRLWTSAQATQLTFSGSGYDTAVQRVVCISAGGRARIAGDGSTTCGATNE